MMGGEVAEVRRLVASVAGVETVEPIADDDPFFESTVIDSLQLISIVDEFQSQFGITVSGAELSPENFGSIAAMARFLAGKRGVDEQGC
jgi:acyl carrier protein